MRGPLIRLVCLLSLLIASSASAVTMNWTFVGNAGNLADPDPSTASCGLTFFEPCGAVSYAYSIGTYEVTNAQYAEFLNAKATVADPFGLYNTNMANPSPYYQGGAHGGITRSGLPGSYAYTAISGRENMPVNNVSFYDALRFANWMNNGQGIGDTETGAYTLLGGTPTPSNGGTITRNPSATIAVTSESEWYKSAYYSAASTSYFDYPAGSNTQTGCWRPSVSDTTNSANCDRAVNDLTIRGSYIGSPSPYGTFDQGGNVWEWNETLEVTSNGPYRQLRGGDFYYDAYNFYAGSRTWGLESDESNNSGFRLAMIPEPSTALLVIVGLLGLAGRRRVSA